MVKPLGTRVILKQDEAVTMSAGGIHIPVQAQEKLLKGTVIAVAEDVTTVKEGDRVMFDKYSDKVQLQEEEICIDIGDILALVEED